MGISWRNITATKYFWYIALAIKLLCAFNSRSIYQSNEIGQAVLVSYDMVYGGGNLPWEWNDEFRLRPVLYPSIFAVVFKILNILYLDFRFLIIYSPNLIHVFFWQISDFYVFKLLKEESDDLNERRRSAGDKDPKNYDYANLAMIMYMGVWAVLAMNARTSANAVETIFLPIGIYYWRRTKSGSEEHVKLEDQVLRGRNKVSSGFQKHIDPNAIKLTLLIVFSFILRPTSLLPWLAPIFWKVFFEKTFFKFLLCGLFIATPLYIFSILLDSLYFWDFPTFTHYNFAKFNVIDGGAGEYFGKSGTFQYIFWAFCYLGGLFPFACIGLCTDIWTNVRSSKFPLLPSICIGYFVILTLIPHKEIRFILPLSFILCYFAAIGIPKFPRAGFILLGITFIYWAIFMIISGIIKNNMHKANDFVYDRDYETVYWSDNEATNYLADLHPGYYDPNNEKVMTNHIALGFARRGFPDLNYLAHSETFDIAYDSVLDLSKKFLVKRNKALTNQTLDMKTYNEKSALEKKCVNSQFMPQYFIIRYNYPDNILYKKIFKWLKDPKVYTEEGILFTASYKEVKSQLGEFRDSKCRPGRSTQECIMKALVFEKDTTGCAKPSV
ncbi:unnamed protein product [Moneuplotes crassus]|uniref:Mannosyltransferase n=1 Tax=Euplotes crassus TaxID=5936 RepID=A0AAD1U4R8_EUPCR|nr:unnamed protein product [Moneuplotes crassus]